MKTRFAFALALLMVLMSASSFAANIGVSPATITIKNMLRSGYSEETLYVSISADLPVTVNATLRGDIADWITFSQDAFTLTNATPYPLKLFIRPPENTANGEYTGFIRIETTGFGVIGEGQAGNVVRAAVDVRVFVDITDVQIQECRASGFFINDVETGEPILLHLDILNQGNVLLSPTVALDLWDRDQTELVKFESFEGDGILPTVQRSFDFEMPSLGLPVGQYWADVEVEQCAYDDTLTFDVLAPGSLKTQGIIKQIVNPPWVKTHELVPITILFANTGESHISRARFVGDIKRGQTIVEEIQTEELGVPVGETINYTVNFVPSKDGRYVISGYVIYDNKRTFEASSILNVTKGAGIGFSWTTALWIILIILFVYIIWKIARERRKRRLY